MKQFITSLCLLIATNSFTQQVDRSIIVEHFTNTYCGVCANKNPDLITNLNNNPNILHISYHPSVPYSQCPLNQHNKTENDNRTKYYNIFNGTPRIVIQGEPSTTSFSSSTLFDSYKNQKASFSLSNTLEQDATKEKLILKVKITKEDASSLTSLNLYAAIVEETLNFNAQNGEKIHHNVFRKSFVGSNPTSVTLPINVGESVDLEYELDYNFDWEGTELKAISILQHDDKSVEQSTESTTLSSFVEPTVSVDDNEKEALSVFPTVFTNKIRFSVKSSDTTFNVSLFSIDGKLLYNNPKAANSINFSHLNLPAGEYIFHINDSMHTYSKKLIKVN